MQRTLFIYLCLPLCGALEKPSIVLNSWFGYILFGVTPWIDQVFFDENDSNNITIIVMKTIIDWRLPETFKKSPILSKLSYERTNKIG